MKCPYCHSTETIFKAKALKWECNSCEERFEDPSPESDASNPMAATKAAKPKRIFFSYGHSANRELVDRFTLLSPETWSLLDKSISRSTLFENKAWIKKFKAE
jgi:hypothetical protein